MNTIARTREDGQIGKFLRTTAAVSSMPRRRRWPARTASHRVRAPTRAVPDATHRRSNLGSETSHEIDLLRACLDRGEGIPRHAQDAGDDLTITAIAGDDHRIARASDESNSGASSVEPGLEEPLVHDERERREQHRDRYHEHQKVARCRPKGWAVCAATKSTKANSPPCDISTAMRCASSLCLPTPGEP